MPTPTPNETEEQFIERCIPIVIQDGTAQSPEQAYAVCSSMYEQDKIQQFFNELGALLDSQKAIQKVSFDFDGVLTTRKGKDIAIKKVNEGKDVYIISARHHKQPMEETAKEIGILNSHIYPMGGNNAKVEKIIELKIDRHYDTNQNVIDKLPGIGRIFTNE